MAGVTGANVKLLEKPEATYGTAATGNYNQLAFTTLSLGTQQALLDGRVLGVGSGRDAGDPILGEIDTSGQAVVPLNEFGIGRWLRLLLGAPDTSGTAPNYIHEFRSGAQTLPSATLVQDLGAGITLRYSVSVGVRATTFSLEFSPTGLATATVGLMAQGGEPQSGVIGGTPVLVSGSNFSRASGAITDAGTPIALVTGAQLEFSNGVEALRTIRSDRKIEEAEIGLASASGTLTARFTDSGLYTKAVSNTPVDLRFSMARSANVSLELRFPRVFLSIPRGEVQGPGGVSAQYTFQASGEGVPAMMIATLRNSLASYAT